VLIKLSTASGYHPVPLLTISFPEIYFTLTILSPPTPSKCKSPHSMCNPGSTNTAKQQ